MYILETAPVLRAARRAMALGNVERRTRLAADIVLVVQIVLVGAERVEVGLGGGGAHGEDRRRG